MSAEEYEITKWIGGGAFGSASVCHRKDNPNKEYVIKKIRLNGLSIKQTQSAIQEARLLRKLSSRYIVEYVDSFATDSGIAIVIEYCDGGDLAAQINKYRSQNVQYCEGQIRRIISQLASALAHCHSLNILHRDVKTENIFICSTSKSVKLGDFGISRVLDAESSMAETQVGTPYYFSPELCKGKPYSYQSDIWALGCVSYELLNLQRPFETANGTALVLAIVRGAYMPMLDDYSAALRSLVQSMLLTDPFKRPTAAHIVQKFKHINSNDPIDCLKTELAKLQTTTQNEFSFAEKLNQLEQDAYAHTDVAVLKHEAELLQMQLINAIGPDSFAKIYEKARKLHGMDESTLTSYFESKHRTLVPKLARLLSIEQKNVT